MIIMADHGDCQHQSPLSRAPAAAEAMKVDFTLGQHCALIGVNYARMWPAGLLIREA